MSIINAWVIHEEETPFPNPDNFDPEQYKGENILAPELAAAADYEKRDHYGCNSGRRLCPGINLAERNLFLAIAKLIWTASIEPGNGKVIEPDCDPKRGYGEGILIRARPAACKIVPRSEYRHKTIMAEYRVSECGG